MLVVNAWTGIFVSMVANYRMLYHFSVILSQGKVSKNQYKDVTQCRAIGKFVDLEYVLIVATS